MLKFIIINLSKISVLPTTIKLIKKTPVRSSPNFLVSSKYLLPTYIFKHCIIVSGPHEKYLGNICGINQSQMLHLFNLIIILSALMPAYYGPGALDRKWTQD